MLKGIGSINSLSENLFNNTSVNFHRKIKNIREFGIIKHL